ncbi:MAG TPA: YdcF family protein [Nitrospiraceae bacterium]|nr:YdcF family protein [Nitrospiraceae bacterium]
MELTPFLFGLYKFVKYGVYPLSWVVVLLGVTTLLSLFPPHPSRLKWIRRSSVTAFMLLVTVSSPLIANQLIGSLETWYSPPVIGSSDRYDAVVVLGGGIDKKGTLRPTAELTSYSRNRTTCGVDLYMRGYAPRLVLTGGDGSVFGSGPKEAPEMKRWAHRLGVPDDAIVTEEEARTTYENAIGTRRLLGQASILLVSSASHLPRATALFSKQGFRVTPVPCTYVAQNKPRDDWKDLNLFAFLPSDRALQYSQDAIAEVIGLAVYWLTGKI